MIKTTIQNYLNIPCCQYTILFMKINYSYLTILLFFALDILCASFFERWIVFALLCYYLIKLFHKTNIPKLSITLVALSLESFVHYGIFGIELLYLIPITLLAFVLKNIFNATGLQPYFLLLISLVAQKTLIEGYLLGQSSVMRCTLIILCVNIGIITGISLKYWLSGRQGNRL